MPGWLVKALVGGLLLGLPVALIGMLLGLEINSWRMLVFTFAVLVLDKIIDWLVAMIWERG